VCVAVCCAHYTHPPPPARSARIRKQRERSRKKFEAEQKGGIFKITNQFVSALNLEEDIEEDRGILASLRKMRTGERMSDKQVGALKRKVGGTKSGFFGESVDVKGTNIEKGYVGQGDDVTAAPFLIIVVLGVLATTAYVVTQTS